MAEFLLSLAEVGMASAVDIILELVQQIQCPVCYEPMMDPQCLTCHHLLCQRCLISVKGANMEEDLLFFKCPICREPNPRSMGMTKNCQFPGVSELVNSLMKAKEKQMCEMCNSGRGTNFLATCNDCDGDIKKMATRNEQRAINTGTTEKVTEMEVDGDICAVCRKDDCEDGDRIWAPGGCSKCGRWYHLDCHYPILNVDIGELDNWECRLCSSLSPELQYGYGSSFWSELDAEWERTILECHIMLGNTVKNSLL